MIAQVKHYLYNKKFSFQEQSKGDQIDTFRNRINCWLNIIDMGGQYLIIFMIMITATMDWIILFAVQI